MRFFCLLFVLFLSVHITAQVNLDQYLNEWLNDKDLAGASVGILVRDSNGEELLVHESDKLLAPASVQKLVTTATALSVFGQERRFDTKLYLIGEVTSQGVLNGDLLIVGGGDPTLGSKFAKPLNRLLLEWVEVIKKRGIHSVTGKILLDPTIFDRYNLPRRWIWEDMGNYYGAAPSGLTINDNSFKLLLNSLGPVGASTQIIKTEPELLNVEFENYVLSSSVNRDLAYVFGAPNSRRRLVKGSIPVNRRSFVVKGALPMPADHLGFWLYNHLQQQEVLVQGKWEVLEKENSFASEAELMHTEYGLSVAEIVRLTNQKSINLYADHLFLLLGNNNGEASYEMGGEVIKQWLNEQGLDGGRIYLEDGSGLSRFNLISPEFVVDLLDTMNKSDQSGLFKKSLSVGGESGTLKRMFLSSPLKGRVYAKSGSMQGVRCYAGYLVQNNGEELIFSIMINNYIGDASNIKLKVRQLLERVAESE